MSNAILHKRRILNEADPLHTDLLLGELAINTKTGKLFMKDNNDAVIDVNSSVISIEVNYTGVSPNLTPVSMKLDGATRSEIILHKGLPYTFRITELQTGGIGGTDIMFYTQATEGGAHQEYLTTVTHFDFHATITIPQDAPDNLKFGIRAPGNGSAIEGSGGDIIYSDQSGGSASGGDGQRLIDSDAVFEWDTIPDVWKTGHDEGLLSSSGKLILGDTTITTSTNTLSFATQTTLDNVLLDAGNYS